MKRFTCVFNASGSFLARGGRKSKLFEQTRSSLVTFQDLELQKFKHLAQPNLGAAGEKAGPALSPFPPAAGRCSDAHSGERAGFGPGRRQVPREQAAGENRHPPRRAEVDSLLVARQSEATGRREQVLTAGNTVKELTW